MVKKSRSPLQVDTDFKDNLKELKRKINAMGEDTSLREITGIMANPKIKENIEKLVLEELKFNVDLEIIKFDRRKRI